MSKIATIKDIRLSLQPDLVVSSLCVRQAS